jgi:hypothetical protein
MIAKDQHHGPAGSALANVEARHAVERYQPRIWRIVTHL